MRKSAVLKILGNDANYAYNTKNKRHASTCIKYQSKGFFCFSCIGITLVVNVHFTTICLKKTETCPFKLQLCSKIR